MSIPFYSNIDLKENKIENVGTPASNKDAVNKLYTDNAISNLHTTISGEIAAEVSDINDAIDIVDGKVDDLDNNFNSKVSTLVQPMIEDNIVDNLTSTNTDKSLSANQGKVLNKSISDLSTTVEKYSSYNEYTTKIGSYGDADLYRIIITDDITTTPTFNDVIPVSILDDVEPGVVYDYEIINAYGSFTTNYDVLQASVDIPKTYKMIPADCLSAVNLTKAYIYLGNVDVYNGEIRTWFKFGSDFQGIFNGHQEILPIKYRIIIEYTRTEVINNS